ncbi:MAG: hypothetical protein EKK61_00845 [Rickettsiales bacterium]|nr:MAG: hypothetical protein EKK61_00845 [Rickettsiales bacterium]
MILFINNKFVDNYLKNIGLSYIEQKQIFLYELSGIILASMMLLLSNNIIKIKNILYLSMILYFFSILSIVFVDNKEIGKLIYFLFYSFGYSAISFIYLSQIFNQNDVHKAVQIIEISGSTIACYFVTDLYFKQIIKYISLDFYELILAEIVIVFIVLLLNSVIFKTKRKKIDIEKSGGDERGFLLILKFSKIELITSFTLFLLLYFIFYKYYYLSNINDINTAFDNNFVEIATIIFLMIIASIIFFLKINIQKLNIFFLGLSLPLLGYVMSSKIYSTSIIICWAALILCFYNIIASNLFLIIKKFERQNSTLAILLYFISSAIGFYNGYIITTLRTNHYFEQIKTYSIYFVILALLVYHLFLLNRYRLYKK